jgi:alpha-tubulin suppressor-like RCC1 family protein
MSNNAPVCDMDLLEADVSNDSEATTIERRALRFARVACGAWHTIALSEQGVVYSWGLGANGRLGHDDALNRVVPTRIDALRDVHIDDLDAGGAHSLFVSKHHQAD